MGSVGITDMSYPVLVNAAVAGSIASSLIRVWKAAIRDFKSGLSIKSTCDISWIPSAFNDKITPDKLHLRISGTVTS